MSSHSCCIFGAVAAAASGAVAVWYIIEVRKARRQKSQVGAPLPHVAEGKSYLDWNATSPIFPEVTSAILPYISTEFGNPSSDHCFGGPSRNAIAHARSQVARLLGCDDDEVVFCGCGTEADNMALKGAVSCGRQALPKGHKPHVISSSIEHPAISVCLDAMVRTGEIDVTYTCVDHQGRVDPSAVAAAVRDTTVLVSIMHSNNEVGTVQDIVAISKAAREAKKLKGGQGNRELLVHTDAAQSVGKVPVLPRKLDADLATIVGHKFGAPKGVAALYVRKGVALSSLLLGGGQESGRRAGTEAVSQIVALGAAADVIQKELALIASHMRVCRDRLHKALSDALGSESIRVNGPPLAASDDHRLPNTLSVGIRGVLAGQVLEDLSKASVAASASAACHSSDTAKAEVSFVLRAMGVPTEFALGTLRLSVGRHTTNAEIDRAVAAIVSSCRKHQ